MRRAADKRGRGRKAATYSQQAPTKGWNTLDSIADMSPEYAIVMDNFIPQSSVVSLRAGNTMHSTGITGTVETLAAYNNATQSKLFAAITDKIYDVTAAGAVGAAVASGKTNGRWQHVNFATPGGSFMYMVNGQDDPMLYDGTTWTAINGLSTPAITGVVTNKFINVSVHMRKLWFIEKDSMRVWYLSSSSIGGAANMLDLSDLFPRGGYLMAMGDWTLDSGEGIDDLAVFISSEGEVAVYRGTDPSTAATWALVGIYQIGAPLSRRCFTKFASDLVIINEDGMQLMSSALSSSRVTLQSSVTDKIQPTISESISSYRNNYGWETILVPPQNCLMFNIPVTNGSHQYVINTITKGWSRFTGWDAKCFELLDNDLYFGTINGVRKSFNSAADNGVAISGKALQAFSNMGSSNLKQFVMARPIISTNTNSLGVLLSLNVDYETKEPVGIPTFTTSSTGTWDNSNWDNATWSGDYTLKKNWQTTGNVGVTGALYIKTTSSIASVSWSATEYIYTSGSGFY
jgi:hypothetical protein